MSPEYVYQLLEESGFSEWVCDLRQLEANRFNADFHGDYARWKLALQQLPAISLEGILFDQPEIIVNGHCQDSGLLRESLMALSPWRKGPYRVAGCYIDSEWRSDYKWQRIRSHLASLEGRRVLDVGCGNGYHCWRMLADDPQLVLGIDPSILFNLQFRALQSYIRDGRIHLLPMGIQHMPSNMQWFDTVFSMGVLYHRKSPFDHLLQLKQLLKPGGELCLETLVIKGGAGEVLVPDERYARMNNVWFLPSTIELERWLKRCGFRNIRTVDINRTTIEEQRSTEWMQFESLSECLQPSNRALTVEGYPAPMRAVTLCERPR